jgi:uncharacterized protein YcbK (DUF882 family)
MLSKKDGYYIWNKGDTESLSPHFKTSEFSCQCSHKECIEQKASIDLINKLENLRGNAGFPLQVTSGFRCAAHQKELGESGLETAKGLSQHELGNAADIRCNSLTSAELTVKAEPLFACIGVARRFVHVDLRPGPKRWSYSY